jgi:hypothetical protein
MGKKDWLAKAANLLKSEIKKNGLDHKKLTEKLHQIGIEDSYDAVANKINCGAFSFAFYLQFVEAINICKTETF